MKERPILFKAPMVRAILNGTKTQTRRLQRRADRCPYGAPGDRLYVKEALRFRQELDDLTPAEVAKRVGNHDIRFLADGSTQLLSGVRNQFVPGRYRHARFMPRWASRITLEVTDVRVERLQGISFDDCLAEGIVGTDQWRAVKSDELPPNNLTVNTPDEADAAIDQGWTDYTRVAYSKLWESINGKGSWDANPWVWVIEFRRVAS